MRLGRYCAASFIVDCTFYILWTVIPFRAIEMGADSFQLGLLPVVTGATYIVASITFGWLSDRLPHAAMLRGGAILAASGMLLVGMARQLDDLFTLAPIASLGTAMFWPTIQAAIGRESGPKNLGRDLSIFNVCWSAGKALGFLVGGVMLAELKAQGTLNIAAAATGLTIVLLPFREFAPEASIPAPAERAGARGFLRAAWVGNFAAFGVSNILNVHYPKFITAHWELGPSEQTFGLFLGAIFVAQTLAFVWLLTTFFWTYRWTPILALMSVMGAAVFLLPAIDHRGWMLLVALPIGLGLGMAYTASIFYSLHGPKRQGLKAGIHEGIIGSANVVPPLVAGWLAERSGDLRWPYWTAALLVALALALQAVLAAGDRTKASRDLSN